MTGRIRRLQALRRAAYESELYGTVIRLMADEDVDCPLWLAGLTFADADELVEFGAAEELARDLARWAAEHQVNGRTSALTRRSPGTERGRRTTLAIHRI